MDINEIVRVVSEELSKYQTSLDTIELEMRLGIYDNTKFDSNIGEDNYNILTKMLESFDGWESNTCKTYTDVSISGNRRIRMIDGVPSECVKKERLSDFTFQCENLPFDIRVSISRETPITIPKIPKTTTKSSYREKCRISKKFQNALFEITTVKYTENNKSLIVYQYEVEHSGPIDNIPNNIYQLLYKILDANYMIDGFMKTSDSKLPLELFSANLV